MHAGQHRFIPHYTVICGGRGAMGAFYERLLLDTCSTDRLSVPDLAATGHNRRRFRRLSHAALQLQYQGRSTSQFVVAALPYREILDTAPHDPRQRFTRLFGIAPTGPIDSGTLPYNRWNISSKWLTLSRSISSRYRSMFSRWRCPAAQD